MTIPYPVQFPYNFGPILSPGKPKNGVHYVGTEQLYELGTRYITWDGREFRYARSGGACYAGQACDFRTEPLQAIDNIAEAAAVGATKIVVDGGTHDALAKDQLRGGYVIIYGDSNSDVQFRLIEGNEECAANADITLYLEEGLVKAATTSTNAEIFPNPWYDVRLSTDVGYTKAGLPAAEVSGAGYYFWVQTKGPCWIAPQANVGSGKYREAFFRHDGSLEETTSSEYDTTQDAGVVVMGSASGVGPLFYLNVF